MATGMVSGLLQRAFAPRLVANSPGGRACSPPLAARDLVRSSFYQLRCSSANVQPSRTLPTSRSTPPGFSFTQPDCRARDASATCLARLGGRHPRRKFTHLLPRGFSTNLQLQQKAESKIDNEVADARERDLPEQPREAEEEQEFARSHRAAQAAQVNLSAKLSKEGKGQDKASLAEIRRLLRLARPEAKWLAIAFVFLLISSTAGMLIPYSIGQVLDVATKGEGLHLFGLTLIQFLAGLAAILSVGGITTFGGAILLRIIGERVVARLRSQLYRRTYLQDAEFFDANRVGDLISRLNADTTIVGKSITQNLNNGLSSLFVGCVGSAVMVWTSPKLTGLLLLMVPPVAVGTVVYGFVIRNISRSIQKNLGILTKIVEERLGNVKTSQAFVGEMQEVRRYNKQIRSVFALGRKESLVTGSYFASTQWAGDMAMIVILAVGGSFITSGTLSIGDFTAFMLYTVYAGSGLFGLSTFYSELMKGVGAASRLFELQDRKPGIYQTVGQPVKSAQGLIKFDNISFAYPTRPGVKIFNNLSFEIPSGSNVCVVGPSGGGKSTIASLLLRFYNPVSGSITIDGVDIAGMNAKSLRRRIGLVAQEPVLLSGTIAENIAYGKPKARRTEIVTAAKRANCTFISDLPDGLNTEVGARGSQLSGGQKQRIAIARALLKDPDILILDEATSALDAESESLVNEALTRLLRGRNTTISIAHRLSTIKRSNWIIVLNNEGQVAEVGSYAQLAGDNESAFNKLMERQMNGGDASGKQPSSSRPNIIDAEEESQIPDEEILGDEPQGTATNNKQR